ncbi:hypothetical protein [Streptomyces pactum]|uniref:hypothetical protein n=1 Tax=Streptomyces pactum TaxID=68249 RepID=UPI000A8B29FE|nr:hypothetical protein [Streptomyces pactum]
MVRKVPSAHVFGVGVLLCCCAAVLLCCCAAVLLCCWNQATTSALRMLREAYIGWMA